jgi:hypothetical protein
MKLQEYLQLELSKHTSTLPKDKTSLDAVNLFILGYRKSGWNTSNSAKYTDSFPEKQKGRNKHYMWFLESRGLKYCSTCLEVLKLSEFHNNNCKKDNKQGKCISCYSLEQKENPERWRAYAANRRSRELNASPSWADTLGILQFYLDCPENMQVDHIIPLKGEVVSGLHVLENLQYLSPRDNMSKSNTYTVV